MRRSTAGEQPSAQTQIGPGSGLGRDRTGMAGGNFSGYRASPRPGHLSVMQARRTDDDSEYTAYMAYQHLQKKGEKLVRETTPGDVSSRKVPPGLHRWHMKCSQRPDVGHADDSRPAGLCAGRIALHNGGCRMKTATGGLEAWLTAAAEDHGKVDG